MTEHHAPHLSGAPLSPIDSECDSITPAMLTLVELDQQQIDSIVRTVPGGVRNVQDIYPLTSPQEGMLFHHLLNAQSDAYVLSTLLELQSRAALEALISALQKVVDRHDILRSAVLWKQLPRPVQVVYRQAQLPVDELAVDRDRDVVEQLKYEMTPQRQKWDLRRAPLIRLRVAPHQSSIHWYALLQLHHVVCDHGSLKLLAAEAMKHLEGRSLSLDKPVPYRTHVTQALSEEKKLAAEAFFRSRLGTVDEPTAPFGLLDVYGDGTRLEETCRLLAPAISQRVRAQARRLDVTAARLFHAAWALVVSRASGRDDVVFGTVLLATRHRVATSQPLLGMFANTLPLRLKLHGITAKELVERAQQELDELLNYADTSLVAAQRCSGIVGSAPLFTAVLNYRHSVPNPDTEWSLAAGIRALTAYQFRTNYPVTVTVDNLGEGFSLTAQTSRRIGADHVIEYLQTAIESLVDALETGSKTPVLALSIMPQNERHQIIDVFNATRSIYPQGKLIHEVFEAQVKRTPDAVAVVYEEQALTYAQLNRRANQLARHLTKNGVGPERLVALCVERGLEMVIGLLGILKAGGAYLPLDKNYPADRLAFMLEDSTPVVLLTQERLKKAMPAGKACVIALDTEEDQICLEPDTNIDAAQLALTSRNLAYVIYTSGSTGAPKGVMIEHRSLCNLAFMQMERLDVQSHSRVLQFASLGFDACTWECVMALCSGARLCVASRENLAAGEPLLHTLRAQQITHATLPPTALRALPSCEVLQLGVLIVAGEACPATLAQQWGPRRRFINAYGPTETTVCATMYESDAQDGDCVPIGHPIANTEIYILDRHGEPVPIGVAGEIHIGGAGVARGYLGRPELTARRFINNPFSANGQSTLYKTGDVGRWQSNGAIEFLGRNDDQVKIRGHRIELGEIEAQLGRYQQVKEAVVVVREDVPEDRRLVAYVVGNRSGAAKVAGDEAPDKLRNEIVSGWETLYEETYGNHDQAAPSFVGWKSSYTGQPIPEPQMQEWLTCALKRIQALRPKRVLEIGCGVGLLVQCLAPECEVYVGTDISTSALEHLRKWVSRRAELKHVELLHRSATELQDLKSGSFNTVVLNSVVQYFPDIEYLLAVLQEAVRLLEPGGKIFLGDLRHLGLLQMFHSAVQLSKAAATISVGQLKKRVARAVTQEKELVIDPQLFQVLPGRLPGVSAVEVQVKRGRASNELTRYRYDVVLHKGEEISAHAVCEPLQWQTAVGSTAELKAALREGRWSAARVCSIPNPRLVREAAAQRLIETSDEHLEAGVLRRQLNELQFNEVDLETFWECSEAQGYDAQVSWGASDSSGCLDIQLVDCARVDQVPRALSQRPDAVKPWSAYANDPMESSFRQQLIPQLREYLKGRLPEYMLPSAWMVLSQLPLTPNGKVDRRALPAPQDRPEEIGEYIAPRTEVELTLADIWAQLLRVDQVGIHDNFFELGGHSLLATRVISRIRERLNVELSISALFDDPTVKQLSARVEAEGGVQAGQEALWMSTLSQKFRGDIDEMHDDDVLAEIAKLKGELSHGASGPTASS